MIDMPIKIPFDLPARKVLENENIFVMTKERAETQDIRPLRILILNLMPKKIETETQLLRVLGNTPLQVDVNLLQVSTHISKNTSQSHLLAFYRTFAEIKEQRFDGMIITGAPVENLDFEAVDYWDELCEIMEWSKTHVFSTFHICWGAQAGLYYHFGIPKYKLPKKMFGIFEHENLMPNHPLMRGFDEKFLVPQSRHTEVRAEDIMKHGELDILASSSQSGVCIIANKNGRQFFVTGHFEYDADTLKNEYLRDKSSGFKIALPENYFLSDNPESRPLHMWKGHAHLLYSNWLNFFVYQKTPFDLNNL